MRGVRIETNLQTTVQKKKYPGKKNGGPPPYFVEHKYLWGGPLFFRGPPHIFFQKKNIWGGAHQRNGGTPLNNNQEYKFGGPPLKFSQTYFLIFMGGPPQILENIGGVSEIITKIWG